MVRRYGGREGTGGNGEGSMRLCLALRNGARREGKPANRQASEQASEQASRQARMQAANTHPAIPTLSPERCVRVPTHAHPGPHPWLKSLIHVSCFQKSIVFFTHSKRVD